MRGTLDFELEITSEGENRYTVAARCPMLRLGEAATTMRLPFDAAALEQQLRLVKHAVLASSATVRRIATRDEQPVQALGGRPL